MQIDWNLTLDTILSGKCILFLGPEVFTDANLKKLEERLNDYLEVNEDEKIKVYSDGLFYFKQRQKRTEVYLKMRRFFQQKTFDKANLLFEKISQIPFHFIISTTPDDNLVKVFEENQLRFKSDFYWKKQVAKEDVLVPTPEVPLIYNMLGSIEKPESLLLTHDDLFDYLESVFQGNVFSARLKDHILNEAQSVIFLGLPFDHWYMPLILRLLELDKNENFLRFADTQDLSAETQTFCQEQFQINFIEQDIGGFIDELFTRCEAVGKLRVKNSDQKSVTERLLDLVKKDKIEEVFNQLEDWLDQIGNRGEAMLQEVTNLSGRFHRLKRRLNQGILSFEESELETNKIRVSLIDVLQNVKGLE